MRVKTILTILLLPGLPVIAFAQQSLLQITSPLDGTVAKPGDTITVTISADPSIDRMLVVGEDPLGFGKPTSNPAQFTMVLPSRMPLEKYRISATGKTANS